MRDFKAIILAGGSGERFWPLSTPERPKQFLNVFGGESLIRQSVNRLRGLVKAKDVFVVTASDLVRATRRELPEVPTCNIIGEPIRRDTGAAIALGVGQAGDGILGFFSSDQLVANPVKFRKTVTTAIVRAKSGSSVVTIGIKPTYPSESFGYVNPRNGKFVEKPNAVLARRYVKSGFLWNAGMFIAKSSVFRTAFAEHAPELVPLLDMGSCRRLRSVYPKLPRISFDYAVMEKLGRVEVVPGDFGWDDVGSYSAFDKYFPHDSRGNVREGPCVAIGSNDNICIARSARISLLGVNNLVVVTTPDSVLVADKSRLSEMKRLFAK